MMVGGGGGGGGGGADYIIVVAFCEIPFDLHQEIKGSERLSHDLAIYKSIEFCSKLLTGLESGWLLI